MKVKVLFVRADNLSDASMQSLLKMFPGAAASEAESPAAVQALDAAPVAAAIEDQRPRARRKPQRRNAATPRPAKASAAPAGKGKLLRCQECNQSIRHAGKGPRPKCACGHRAWDVVDENAEED